MYFPDSELIINPSGSIYHLNLHPDQIAETIIFVGDQDRVAEVSKHFTRIDSKIQHREFITHTGEINNKRVSVVSTGIGTDNIDIVINELDALVNIDFQTRELKPDRKTLKFIRIGTSGALQPDISVDSFLLNTYSLGLDGLMHFYDFQNTEREKEILYEILVQVDFFPIPPYLFSASKSLYTQFNQQDYFKGITATCTGFYGPQGRQLRGELSAPNLVDKLSNFDFGKFKITNFEMETAGIYGLASILDHEAISINAILANRVNNEFSKNPQNTINRLIETVLEKI